MPWYSRRVLELLLLLHYSVSRMEFKAQNDLQPHRKLRNISVMVNKKKAFKSFLPLAQQQHRKKLITISLTVCNFSPSNKRDEANTKKRAPTTTCFHHCFPYAIMPISTFARFSHCAICLASYLMIIMWKDQLITHRVSDLNEWNAENIERKIQLYAALWSWGAMEKKMLPRQGANENKKKTISFVAEWIHLFLRLPSLLCFISSSYSRLKLVLFMKMPNVPFVGVIINCCAVNYNLKLRGKLKTAESGILRHCLTRRQ